MSPTISQVSEKEAWSLQEWLSYLESTHTKTIDLGLSRVKEVFNRLALDFSHITVITVAGTNGKGTTCAFIEQSILCANESVAVYSSPHINDYRERVRVNGNMLAEAAHCNAFWEIDKARQDTPLSYFEFGTLAGLFLIAHSQSKFALLEVGLGGRLDAVNIVDPDIAVITSIGLDHQDWLGHDENTIAAEKAGILRANITAVIGETEPYESLLAAVKHTGAQALWQQNQFSYSSNDHDWSWHSKHKQLSHLPLPHIPMQNVSTALATIQLLDLKLSDDQIKHLVSTTHLPGRYQVLQNTPKVVLDVAHNPQATLHLSNKIKLEKYNRLHLVVGMLSDKDIVASIEPLLNLAARWYTADLASERGAKAEAFVPVLVGQELALDSRTVYDAYQNALSSASDDDLIVVFGSFFTIAEILQGEA